MVQLRASSTSLSSPSAHPRKRRPADRRPTTDDRRPTTDDRRTTNDERRPTNEVRFRERERERERNDPPGMNSAWRLSASQFIYAGWTEEFVRTIVVPGTQVYRGPR
jgi:hypothetical protein